MRTPRRLTAILVVGAVAIASAAYALGTQAGGGSAVAGDSRADGMREPPPPALHERCGRAGHVEPPLRDLARALDVTPSELRRALRQIWDDRRPERGDRHDDLAEFLAERLELSVERVEEALRDALPRPPGPGFSGGPGPGFGPPGGHP